MANKVSIPLHFVSACGKSLGWTSSYCLRYNRNGYRRKYMALRVPGGWGSHISWQSAHEDGKAVSPTHRPPLSLRKYPWYSFMLEAGSTPGPQFGRKDYVNENIPMASSGNEPAIFRFVAQCLDQLRHPGFTQIHNSNAPEYLYVSLSSGSCTTGFKLTEIWQTNHLKTKCMCLYKD